MGTDALTTRALRAGRGGCTRRAACAACILDTCGDDERGASRRWGL